ncbi:hypothetical protein SeMB42_g01496 [Synchytrium endobioticum]|uniref:Uncharacterized protein n=1 Tax=Synchytrium endobioticum TaxID=286115 RepID=A0A507DKZ3_9FUNG|nr:hypothetical protein SeMB42_g01496 [Synchytrium endobioticum]
MLDGECGGVVAEQTGLVSKDEELGVGLGAAGPAALPQAGVATAWAFGGMLRDRSRMMGKWIPRTAVHVQPPWARGWGSAGRHAGGGRTASDPQSGETLPARLRGLSVHDRYGRPLASFVVWTSLAFMGAQYLWIRLDFEEYRMREDDKLAALQREVDVWKKRAEGGKENAKETDYFYHLTYTDPDAVATRWSYWDICLGANLDLKSLGSYSTNVTRSFSFAIGAASITCYTYLSSRQETKESNIKDGATWVPIEERRKAILNLMS